MSLLRFAAVGLSLALFTSASSAQTNPVEDDPNWGCYDPAPGHPTASEQAAFIAKASRVAVSLEQEYGVPAAALAAMAAQESGYGWTRIARMANNYFGWKAKEGAPDAYRLRCQPTDSDPNAFYVKFQSIDDSMATVANNLRTSRNYEKVTARYQADLKAGVDPAVAARLWIDGIAPRYNGEPWKYRTSLRRMMNDPLSPSDVLNPGTTLYKLAPKPTAAKARYVGIAESIAYKTVLDLADSDLDPAARTMDKCVDGSGNQVDFPEYIGYPVKRCIYELEKPNRLRGLVYTLNPSKEQVATWVAYACLRATASDQSACAKRLFRTGSNATEGLFENNNAQYPVAGNVIEIGYAGNCQAQNVNNNIFFAHGITVKLAELPTLCSKEQISIERQDHLAKSQVETYKMVARVSALRRDQFTAVTGQSPTDKEWARINQLSHLTAMDDGVNALLNIQAERLFGRGH
jgi:hypothetical protein